MSLLPGPTLDNYLRVKNSLELSNGQAVYQSGEVRPVWIKRNNPNADSGNITDYSQMFVETEDYQWLNPNLLPGFLKTELTPENGDGFPTISVLRNLSAKRT